MSEAVYEGGCHCGAVRFRARGAALNAALCHCVDCRNVSGAPLVAWASFPVEQFEFTHGQPKVYASSGKAERQFCADCGTPLTYRRHGDDSLDVTSASLDDPEALPPRFHVFTRERLSWVHVSDDLPQFPGWSHEGP